MTDINQAQSGNLASTRVEDLRNFLKIQTQRQALNFPPSDDNNISRPDENLNRRLDASENITVLKARNDINEIVPAAAQQRSNGTLDVPVNDGQDVVTLSRRAVLAIENGVENAEDIENATERDRLFSLQNQPIFNPSSTLSANDDDNINISINNDRGGDRADRVNTEPTFSPNQTALTPEALRVPATKDPLETAQFRSEAENSINDIGNLRGGDNDTARLYGRLLDRFA